MPDQMEQPPAKNDVKNESFANRVRETRITGALLCMVGVLLRFFAPILAGQHDTLFLRTTALHHIAVWLYVLGGLLLILCFAFWLADGMLANRQIRQ